LHADLVGKGDGKMERLGGRVELGLGRGVRAG